MASYTAEHYEPLFDKSPAEASAGGGRRKCIKKYRTKRVQAGPVMDIMIYPVWIRQEEAARAKKAMATRAAQAAQNEKDARRKLRWLINANFGERDLALTLTYKGDDPASIEDARKDVGNYIRRVQHWRKKQGMDPARYIYVIECGEGKRARVHHHILMTGMDRDVAERLWSRGRANSSRLQPDERGLEGLARYISKDPKGKKRWGYSKGLKRPTVTVSDSRVSRRQVDRMAFDEQEARRCMERLAPGYVVNEVEVRISPVVSGLYITASLHKEGKMPWEGTEKPSATKTRRQGSHHRNLKQKGSRDRQGGPAHKMDKGLV